MKNIGFASKSVLLFGLILIELLTLNTPQARATTNDTLFKDCMKQLNGDHAVLNGQVWQTEPLNKKFYNVLQPSLTDDHVIRWLPHKNNDGSLTVIVMTRDPDPSFAADDPDLFMIMIERKKLVSINEIVSVHAMAFTKADQHGVAGILSCKDDFLASGPLSWNGNTWN